MTLPIGQPRVLNPHELQDFRNRHPETRLLDVRSPGEFETQHIVGSYNVPLETLPDHRDEIRASVAAPVVLICQSGSRARKAEAELATSGMPNLLVLEGGVTRWGQDGFELQHGGGRISLERQVRIAAGGLAMLGGALAVLLHPVWGLLAAAVGSGLVFAGLTDSCAMGMALVRLPYNRPASCDIEATVRALGGGPPPPRDRKQASPQLP